MSKREAHPFERTIGPGPYRFIGVGKIHVSETFGARYIGPECDRGCGTSAHCGHGIMTIFIIRAGDGKNYGVGSDCIAKSEMPYEVKTAAQKAESARRAALRKAKKDEARKRRVAQDDAELAAFATWWASEPKAKASWKRQPHPNDYMAKEKGLSLFDYIEWCIANKCASKLRFYAAFIDESEVA